MDLPRAAVGVFVLGVLLGGCGGEGRERAAEDTALALLRAVQRDDGGAACALLAPETRSQLEQSSGSPCPAAVLEELSGPSPVRRVAVSGRAAQVVMGADTVFLAVLEPGWRVVAAGCERRAELPYDCRVQGV